MNNKMTPPNSWADRKAKALHDALPTLPGEGKRFVYIGCCVELDGEDITEMSDSSEDSSLELMREHCTGFDAWAEVMGYDEMGLSIENDLDHLSFGKSWYSGMPCYWVDHSRIEYIWVDSECLIPEVQTGRMSCKEPNISNRPRSDAGWIGINRDERLGTAKPNMAPQIPRYGKGPVAENISRQLQRDPLTGLPFTHLPETTERYGIGAYASKSESDGGESEPDGSEGK